MDGSSAAVKPKAKLKGNKKEEKEKNPKGKIGKGKGKEVVLNYAKFEGQGLSYKAKLFGFVEVPGPRGDQSSVQAIQKLKQQAKQLKKGANEHKLKITFNITLQGVRLFNEKTQAIEHEHPIHKISFIYHDPEDRHVFGYIYSPPRSAANEARKYYLFAIKSDKSADVITVQLYELFQVVYKMQENKKIQGKDSAGPRQKQHEKSSQPLEPLQDKMLLEMSNKIAGDQQQYPPEEHLYAEPTFVKRTPSEPRSDYASPASTHTSSASESNEYQVPRQEDEISEKEREDIATAIALSLSVQENSQPFSDSVSTPTTNNDSGFEAVFDSTTSFPTEEIASQNTFHAEFPPFENGLTSPENVKSQQGFSESSNDSEKINIPTADETQMSPSNEISFNAFGNLSSNTDVKADFETSQNRNSSIDNDVRSSSDPSGEVTSNSTETEDMNSNSTKVEIQPEERIDEDRPCTNPTIADFSAFESEKQNNDANEVETETPRLNETNKSVTHISFEVNFETENEDEVSSKQTQQDMFSFEPSSDAFPSNDPFASTDPTEFDQSTFNAFGDDDPFSPKGSTKVDSNSDPFADHENPFTADFADVNSHDFEESKAVTADATNPFGENDNLFSADFSNVNRSDFEQPKSVTPDATNSEDEVKSNGEDDIFEAMFEAKMEEQFENETLNKDAEENAQSQAELVLRESTKDINAEHDDKKEEIVQTTVESQAPMALSNEEKTEADEVEVLNDSAIVDNTISDHEETESSNKDAVNKGNTFDFSSNDVYVTLKTAAPANDRSLSPNEFSPPPLPPRPVIPKETIDTMVGPKVPPALPPRPTMNQPPPLTMNQPPPLTMNQPPQHSETVMRKPPELPPRLDLEENSPVEIELVGTEQELNTESFVNQTESSVFEANFDTFDFDHIESNSPVGNVGTPSGFDSGDPFKDPFGGADPFQTPIAGDPFASSTSFDRDVQQDSDDFDPFSGDDPFAMTPAFDPQASFDSPFNTNLSAINETKKDEEKDKFADFSAAFT